MSEEEEAPPQPAWEGPFNEDGLPHGKGSMKYPPPPAGEDEEEKPGDMFDGNMVNGKRVGAGKYTWSNGTVFEGSYMDGKKNGKGKWSFPDKSLYEGDFVEDHMEGDGLFTYGSGDMYMGKFKESKREGSGMYNFRASKSQLIGEWKEGEFESGRWVYQDGSVFVGSFASSSPAEGSYYYSGSQLLQSGKYADGTWNGKELGVGKVEQLFVHA